MNRLRVRLGEYGIAGFHREHIRGLRAGRRTVLWWRIWRPGASRKIAFLSGRPRNGRVNAATGCIGAMEQNGLECPEELTVDRPESGVQDSAWGETAAEILLSGDAHLPHGSSVTI